MPVHPIQFGSLMPLALSLESESSGFSSRIQLALASAVVPSASGWRGASVLCD